MFNCYRVFIGRDLIAIVKTQIAGENLIKMFSELHHPCPEMRIEGAFIDGAGF